jgi:glutathione S-transferase
MKSIPYKTQWVHNTSIESEMKRIGAQPTWHAVAQAPRYTLPAIFDPRTKTAVADSLAIIEHLDASYPETRPLLPAGTRALQRAFIQTQLGALQRAIFPLVVAPLREVILPDFRPVWQEQRERWLGMPLSEVAPPGEKRRAALEVVLTQLDTIAGFMKTNGESSVFVMGSTLSYCDAVLAAIFTWMRRILGEESPEYLAVMKANHGRWSSFMDACKQWEMINDD